MIRCRKCGAFTDAGTKCSSCGFLNSVNESPDISGIDRAAEKMMKDMVSKARRSRVERLAGQFLAATIRDSADLGMMLYNAERVSVFTAFEKSRELAERFIDWFDKQEEEPVKEKPDEDDLDRVFRK